MTEKKIIGLFSHHKCASTWLNEIFSEICFDLGLHFKILYKDQDFDNDLDRYIKHNNIDFIAYANADFKNIENLKNLVGVHIVRDPRDIIVSAYFSHLKTHSTKTWPELSDYRKKLQDCDQNTGLFYEIEFRKEQFEEMRSWKKYIGENILEVRMEDVTSRTYQSILTMADFMGLVDKDIYNFSKRLEFLFAKFIRNISYRSKIRLPGIIHTLPVERILGIVWKNEFESKTGGRKIGEENINSHYRKGLHGDWKNYLTEDHITLIKQEYNDIILQYGYEDSYDW